MTTTSQRVTNQRVMDLINDPICLLLMESDGISRREVLTLMRHVKPLVGCSAALPTENPERLAA